MRRRTRYIFAHVRGEEESNESPPYRKSDAGTNDKKEENIMDVIGPAKSSTLSKTGHSNEQSCKRYSFLILHLRRGAQIFGGGSQALRPAGSKHNGKIRSGGSSVQLYEQIERTIICCIMRSVQRL